MELQQALQRARHERARHEVRSMAVGASEHDPPISPTRSPNVTRAGLSSGRDEASFVVEDDEPPPPPMVAPSGGAGFFENELRGYRLLKASKLSQAKRQHVLTLTKNSTHFAQIRQALRSLFSDGADQADDHHGRFPRKTVWFNEENNDWEHEDEWWPDDDSWWSEADAYWADWSPSSWDDGYEAEEIYMLVFMMTELEGKIAALKRLRVSSGWKRPTLLRQRPTRPWRKHAKRWQEFEQLVATSIQLAPKAILDISEVEKAREKDRPRGRAKDPEDLVRASSADNQDTAMPSALTGGPEKEGRRQLHHRLLRGVPSSARARARAPPRGRRARSSSPTTRRSGCPTSMSSA